MTNGAQHIWNGLPSIALLAAFGATLWILAYWSWRGFSKAAVIAVIRFPLAVLAWFSSFGSGAERLRQEMLGAMAIDEETARRGVKFPNSIGKIYAHAILRLGTVERPSSLTRRILRDEEVEREAERGRREVLPLLREDRLLIELALGGKESLSAFLSLIGSGMLGLREQAAAVVILAKTPDPENRKVALYHLDKLISAVSTSEGNQNGGFSPEELGELRKIRNDLDRSISLGGSSDSSEEAQAG